MAPALSTHAGRTTVRAAGVVVIGAGRLLHAQRCVVTNRSYYKIWAERLRTAPRGAWIGTCTMCAEAY
jgi:hypothetical protein